MRGRWRTMAVAALVGVLGLPACGGDGTPSEDRPRPDTLFHPGMDVPGAAGSMTPEVDRLPEPRLGPDTLEARDTVP